MSDLLISSWYVVNSVVKFIDCNKFILCYFCHLVFFVLVRLITCYLVRTYIKTLFASKVVFIWMISALRILFSVHVDKEIVHESVAQWLRPLLSS